MNEPLLIAVKALNFAKYVAIKKFDDCEDLTANDILQSNQSYAKCDQQQQNEFSVTSYQQQQIPVNLFYKLQGFSIACLALHFYSFDDRDILTSFLATGTFSGYIVVVVGVFAGALMRAPIHKRIDIFFSVLGCALFVASGVFIIEAWEYSFRTRTRDLALIKASMAIVNGVLFGFDAIFTFRDN